MTWLRDFRLPPGVVIGQIDVLPAQWRDVHELVVRQIVAGRPQGYRSPLQVDRVPQKIVWCASMSAMGDIPMSGGWTMSMAWMPMCGQTWSGAGASFVGMWVVMMMVAMMLPSLAPMLWRYRQAVGRTGETRPGRLTALVDMGYFSVWTVFGMVAFPLGVALAAVTTLQPALARAVPIAIG